MNSTIECTIEAVVDEFSPKLHDISLKIHANPELAFEEHSAHDLLTSFLTHEGFKVTKGAFGLSTAFLAEFGPSGPGIPTVAFLSEYDALPKIGHACGHNLIAICGIGAALGVKAAILTHSLKVNLKVFGTPAEERGSGKITMIREEAFKDVDIALMAHPGNINCLYAKYLALEQVFVEYFGKSAHAAASPWDGVNALDAFVQAYNAIGLLRQQIIPTSRIHGIVRQGGEAPNIIPDYTKSEFYVRSSTIAQLNQLIPRVKGCFEAGALATGCAVKITETPALYDVNYNEGILAVYQKHMERLGASFPSRSVQESASRGSTDMGNVTYTVPGIHPVFDIGCKADIHTEVFRDHAKSKEAHDAAIRVIKCLAMSALECVLNPDLLASIKEEFRRTTQQNH